MLAITGSLLPGIALPAAAQQTDAATGAAVIVAKARNACFSDLVRVTGFITPRRIAVAGVDTEGSRVAQVLVREGAIVTADQELARLIPPGGGQPTQALRAPAAGLIMEVRTREGAPASPQGGPMFRIAVDNEIELDAEVPSIHLLKLNPGASARVSIADQDELTGKVRLVAAEIDPRTQLGHVRLSINSHPSLRIGMFARATIAARRSCGVAVPRSAVDHQNIQVVNNGVIETRRVETGLTSDTQIEILSGIGEGENVVASAGTSLHDGDRVRAVTADDLDQPSPVSRP
jgi:multidrug efflux pump subunit AcrA (membrane-fusion protein)